MVTMSCWWFYDGDRFKMLATFFVMLVIFRGFESVTNILNLSTIQFVSNIRHQHWCLSCDGRWWLLKCWWPFFGICNLFSKSLVIMTPSSSSNCHHHKVSRKKFSPTPLLSKNESDVIDTKVSISNFRKWLSVLVIYPSPNTTNPKPNVLHESSLFLLIKDKVKTLEASSGWGWLIIARGWSYANSLIAILVR